jgi:hypothetical protein
MLSSLTSELKEGVTTNPGKEKKWASVKPKIITFYWLKIFDILLKKFG